MAETADDINIMYEQVRAAEDTPTRMQVFARYGFELPPIDNYSCLPGSDPVFERGWHRWYYLYQCTTGVERASILAIAFELHRSNPSVHLHGTGFFDHAFSDATRKFYIAKAVCIANMGIIEDMDPEEGAHT